MTNTVLSTPVSELYRLWQGVVQEPGGILWVGFSGGLDSTALVLSLLKLREADSLDIRCIHVNHGIHSQSDVWAKHCAAFCEHHQLPLEVRQVSVPETGNLEANARQARYECFTDLVGRGDSLWLAHHRNDQFETGLLRILQGRGLLRVRQYQQIGKLAVLRPLLRCDKQELERYVTSLGEKWVEDVSNTDTTFDRNFLRQRVIPAMLERWPDAPDRLSSSIGRADDTRRAFQQTLAALDEVSIDMIPQDAALAIAWLQVFLESRGCFHSTSKSLEEFKHQLDQGRRARLEFGDGSGLVVKRQRLCFLPPNP